MAELRHTAEELKQWQALPLDVKVGMTMTRIRQWVHEFFEDGVYVSFSGGKDSTVLSHLVDRAVPGNSIPRVFVNTGLEFPEIVTFVKEEPRAILLRPHMNFKQVIEKYGYPFISKEVSQTVYEASYGQMHSLKKLKGLDNYENSQFGLKKWQFFLEEGAPRISHKCCAVMKKKPTKEYEKQTGRKPMLATMAEESLLRKQKWMHTGCNAFNAKRPMSTPMAFWTEQDVLEYIRKNNVKIAPVYGDIIADVQKDGAVKGQMRIEEFLGNECGSCRWRTTGARRTGCMFCGFGAHSDRPGEGRFVRMKKTHPKIYEWIMKPKEEGGLDYKNVIDWINEHGGTHIEY